MSEKFLLRNDFYFKKFIFDKHEKNDTYFELIKERARTMFNI